MEKNNSNKLYGVKLGNLYDYDIDKSFEFVSSNTDYLNNINKSSVKTILFSYGKEIIVLLNNGCLTVNGVFVRDNVDRLWFQDATMIYSITNDNEIIIVTRLNTQTSKLINNNNYKYKKVVTSLLSLVALRFDGQIRAITPYISVGILPERFINVDDIQYIVNEEDEYDYDIVVKQNDHYYSLFTNDTE